MCGPFSICPIFQADWKNYVLSMRCLKLGGEPRQPTDLWALAGTMSLSVYVTPV